MSKKLEERNLKMADDRWNKGVSRKFLAKQHNISATRVHQIVNEYKDRVTK